MYSVQSSCTFPECSQGLSRKHASVLPLGPVRFNLHLDSFKICFNIILPPTATLPKSCLPFTFVEPNVLYFVFCICDTFCDYRVLSYPAIPQMHKNEMLCFAHCTAICHNQPIHNFTADRKTLTDPQ